jgi:hypothetical protein
MNIKNLGIFGYLLIILTYFFHLKENIDKNSLLTFGSSLILLGYIIMTVDTLKLKNKEEKIYYGHLILTLYYCISFIIPINEHFEVTDLIALFGHALCIKHNNNNNNKYGYLLLLIYYLSYVGNHFNRIDTLNKIKITGCVFVICYYFNIIQE